MPFLKKQAASGSDKLCNAAGASAMKESIPLLLVMALGMGLRLYRLDEQSVWGDEFFSVVVHLHESSLAEYIQLSRMYVDHPLLIACMTWLWSTIAGTSIFGLRLLPVLFGVAAIPLVYLLGRRLNGFFCGITASLLLALSPVHIWHSQGLRPYVLAVFFALLSLYAFFRMRESGKWFFLCVFANAALFYAHWISVVYLAVLTLLYFLERPYSFRKVVYWPGAHALLTGPFICWFLLYGRSTPALSESYISNLEQLIWVFSDQNLHGNGLFFSWPLRYSGELLFAGVILLAVLYAAVGRLRRQACASSGPEATRAAQNSAERPVLLPLAILYFLPACILLVLTGITGVPLLTARYLLTGIAARYLLMAYLVSRFRPPLLRWGLFLLILGVYAIPQPALQRTVTRTDWFHAAQDITERALPGDVIITSRILDAQCLEYHLPDDALPHYTVSNPGTLCDAIALHAHQRCHGGEAARRSVWFIANMEWDDDALIQDIDAELAACGFRFEKLFYPALQQLMVYRIIPCLYEARPPSRYFSEDVTAALQNPVQVHLEGFPEIPALDHALLRRLYRVNVSLNHYLTAMTLHLALAGQERQARFTAKKALSVAGGPWPAAAMRFAMLARPGRPAAGEAVETEAGAETPCMRLLAPYFEAAESGDWEKAETEAMVLKKNGHPWAFFLRALAVRKQHGNGYLPPFGILPVNMAAEKQPLTLPVPGGGLPESAALCWRLGEICDIARNYPDALYFYHKALELPPQDALIQERSRMLEYMTGQEGSM
jgi:mannosyltransferase